MSWSECASPARSGALERSHDGVAFQYGDLFDAGQGCFDGLDRISEEFRVMIGVARSLIPNHGGFVG